MYEDRRFVIIPADKINLVDFTQVKETSPETCIYSVDKTLTFVKYDGLMPSSISLIEGRSQEYTYQEFINELASPVWQARR